jgi:DNA polymerase III delta subunit
MPSVPFPIDISRLPKAKLWLISGDDPFLTQNTIDHLCAQCPKTMRIERKSMETLQDWQALLLSHQQMSILPNQSCTLMSLKNWTLPQEGSGILSTLTKAPIDQKRWILYGPKLTKAILQKPIMKPMIAMAHHLAIWPMDEAQIHTWAHYQAKYLKLPMTEAAIRTCIQQADGHPPSIWQQLRHLSLLDLPDPIDIQEVKNLIEQASHCTIFAWHDLILAKDFSTALRHLPTLKTHSEPLALITLMQKAMEQVTQILWAKQRTGEDAALLRKLYPWPKQQQMVRSGIMTLSPKKITEFRQGLFAIERSIKTVYPYDAWLALSVLIQNIDAAMTAPLP